MTWYMARVAGMVTWSLLAVSVMWGLMLASKRLRGPLTRPWLLDLHRFLAGLAFVFLFIHVTTILADSFVTFSLKDVLVPFSSKWHPLGTSLGIISMWLAIAVELTSLIKKRLSRTLWHTIHLLAYPVFVFTTVHGLTVGTDAKGMRIIGTALAACGLVVLMTMIRITAPPSQKAPRRNIQRQLSGASQSNPKLGHESISDRANRSF